MFWGSNEELTPPPLPPPPPELGGIRVGGEIVTMNVAQAILEALEAERPDLFGFMKALPSDDSISYDERITYMRQFIQQDYDNRASTLAVQDSMPKAPPVAARTKSEQQSYELALRLDEEEAVQRTVFNCVICMDETPIHGSFTLDCSHRFCSDCLQGYIGSKIRSNEVSSEQLVCPQAGCNCPIPHTTVRGCTIDVGDNDMFEKFDAFATEGYIEKEILSGGFMRCPNETCNFAFQWNPDGSALHFSCPSCSSEYCLNCTLVSGGVGPGHAPYTCAMQAERNEQIAEEKKKFEEWKGMNARASELFEELVRKNGWKSKAHRNYHFVNIMTV